MLALHCTLDTHSLYSTVTHKEVRVSRTSPYHIKPNKGGYSVGHRGKVRTYRYHRDIEEYSTYTSGKYILLKDNSTGRLYLRRVDKPYTVPLHCKEKTE